MILKRRWRKLAVVEDILSMGRRKIREIECKKLTVLYCPMKERRLESLVNTQVIPNKYIKVNQEGSRSIKKKILNFKNTQTIETKKSNIQIPSKNWRNSTKLDCQCLTLTEKRVVF